MNIDIEEEMNIEETLRTARDLFDKAKKLNQERISDKEKAKEFALLFLKWYLKVKLFVCDMFQKAIKEMRDLNPKEEELFDFWTTKGEEIQKMIEPLLDKTEVAEPKV